MLLISVEDANGVRLGAGPITSATGWRHRGEVNRAGSFSFVLPASDPKAALIRPFRWVRAWVADGRGLREEGRGRVSQVRRTINADGIPMLEVSGPDELGALADRVVHRAELHDERQMHPIEVAFGNATTDARAMHCTDFQVGDTSTWSTNANADIVIKSLSKFSSAYFTLHSAQTNDSGGWAYYSSASGWRPLAILEETTSNGAPNGTRIWFDHNGYFRWEPPSDWAPVTGEFYYEIRLERPNPGGWSAFDIADVWIGGVVAPTNDALTQILSHAPGWQMDAAHGYTQLQPRPTNGVELVENGDFETFTGTPDNATTDAFTGWSTVYVNDGTGDSVLASTTRHGGAIAAKLTHSTGTAATSYAGLRQVLPVQPGMEYTLSFWTRGDGVGQLAFFVYDETNDIRLTETVHCGVTGTDWVEVRRTFTTLGNTASIGLYFYAPFANNSAAWVDDVSLQVGGNNAVYLTTADESVLETFIRVAELTGEKFTTGLVDKSLLWLGRDARPSGLRAVGFADPVGLRSAGAAADNIVVILDAEETQDAADLVSRVYIYGAGSGTSRLLPYWSTLEPPDGYVLDRTAGYIERTAAVVAMGVIEGSQQWDDIVPVSARSDLTDLEKQAVNEQARVQAANQLVLQGVTWLEQHSCTDTDPETGDVPKFYHLTIGPTVRRILPGYTIDVRYTHWRDGVLAFAINRTLWITAADTEVLEDGSLVTTGLDVATVPRQPISEVEMQLRHLRRVRGLSGHTASEGC